jgi:heptosyltransferase III
LAEKLSRARLFLGNDSGVTHLAAALGIPTLALFGPSNDTQWRPVGPAVTLLRPSAPHSSNLELLEESTVLHEMLAELRRT